MTDGAPRRRPGLDLALTLFLLATLVWRGFAFASGAIEGPDLVPRPDALEYALAAESWCEGQGFTLELEGARYPTRYPPGFAIVAAPFVATWGIDHAWWAALVLGSLTTLLVAFLGRIVAGRIGFVVAGAVAFLSPAMIRSSQLAMSETSSQFCFTFAMLGAALLSWRAETPRRRIFGVACLVVAFGCLIRYTNLAFVVPLVGLAMRRGHDGVVGKPRLGLAVFATGACVAALALFAARNFAIFGHPLHDGYRYWVPNLYASGLTFSVTYLWQPLAGLFTTGNLVAYGQQLSGLAPNLWTLPVALLSIVGMGRAFALRRSCPCSATMMFATVFTAPAIVAFYAVYAWQDPRFLEPLIPLVAVLAGNGAAAIASRFGTAIASLVAIGVLAHAATIARPLLAPTPPNLETYPLLPFHETGVALLTRWMTDIHIAIVDFDPSLARRPFSNRTRLVVTDLESAAPHYARIADHALVGLDGATARIAALTRKGVAVDEEIGRIEAAIEAGANVLYFEAQREGNPGPGIERLRSKYEFHEERLLPGDWLFEAWSPPVRAFTLRKR